MAFVHELVPQTERSFLEKYGLPFWHRGKWTVDRERGVYLVPVKTEIHDGIFSEYCLIFKNEKISINIERQGMRETTADGEKRFTGIIIESVTAPKKLALYRDEIADNVTAAFAVEFENPKILKTAEPTFGFRDFHNNRSHNVTLLEVEQYTGYVTLFCFLPQTEIKIRAQIDEAERICKTDPDTDFVGLMCKGHIWGTVDLSRWGDEIPDWRYDRDTGELYSPRG